VDGAVRERLGKRTVDEPVLLDERKPLESPVDDGDVEVVAAPGPVDHLDLLGLRKGGTEKPCEPLAHHFDHTNKDRLAWSGMRRLLVGVVLAAALVALLGASPSAAFDGKAAKRWVAKIAGVGPRPAGGENERRAGAIVRRRFNELGYNVTTQRVPLPEGGRSLNVVGRTPGPLRVIIVAHMDGMPWTQAANDNGSGVGTTIMLAKYLKDKPGVLVAALGAEERRHTGAGWHLGSRKLTRSLTPSEKAGVRLALSIDMVGVGTTLNIRGLEYSPNRSARKLLRAADALGVRASYLRDTGQSDHDDLTRGGVPAAWIEWRWDDCWHRRCDRIHRVKPWKLWQAGRTVREAALRVVGRTSSRLTSSSYDAARPCRAEL
jgi:Peptidase family M28